MDTAKLQIREPALLSPNCSDSHTETGDLYIWGEKKKSTHHTQITAWFTPKGSGQGQINEISSQRLSWMRWCDIPARVRGGAAAGAAAAQAPQATSETCNCMWYEQTYKQKAKIKMLYNSWQFQWWNRRRKWSYCGISWRENDFLHYSFC